jgi:hypothetical protein
MHRTFLKIAGWILLAAWLGLMPGSAAAAGSRTLTVAAFRDRLKGGFVGQMAGVAYAAPYEFRFDGRMAPQWLLLPWWPSRLAGALNQDDIYVELTFLAVWEREGMDAPSSALARAFGESKYLLWHANKAARDNIRAGIMPPLSGHPRFNPHADDIDFQIEADVFGLICPGLPAAAQELTWRVGHLMNYGDGVYGGVFIAAMYAEAYFEPDPVKVVQAGLAAIPAESVYARTIADVLAAHARVPGDWRVAWRVVEDNWAGKLHCPSASLIAPAGRQGIGANVNGAYVVIGLLYGQGDPRRTLAIATRCGRDCDCNAASAMGILGAIKGFSGLDHAYVAGLEAMKGLKFAYTDYDWPGALAAMEAKAREMVAASGGAEREGDGGPVWEIPVKALLALPLEQWPYGMKVEDVPLPPAPTGSGAGDAR